MLPVSTSTNVTALKQCACLGVLGVGHNIAMSKTRRAAKPAAGSLFFGAAGAQIDHPTTATRTKGSLLNETTVASNRESLAEMTHRRRGPDLASDHLATNGDPARPDEATNGAPPETPARPVILLVMGMPRSGTSALTRILSLCGATLPAAMMGADSGNARGYWEPRKALRLNHAILHRRGSSTYDPSLRLQEDGAFGAAEKEACITEIAEYLGTLPATPLVIIKDLQITALSGMWFEAAERVGFDVAVVIAVRHPQEVTASLGALMQATPELASALWLKYNLLAERQTRNVPRVFVDYADVLDDWRHEVTRISASLGIDLSTHDGERVEEFLTEDLRHQRYCGPVPELFGADWMSTVYNALRVATRDEPLDTSALDRVFEAYRASELTFRKAFEDFHHHSNNVRV